MVAPYLDLQLTQAADNPLSRALTTLRRRLSVSADDKSYAIVLHYESQDPQFAANVVNALAAIYVEDQYKDRARVAERASAWLKTRLKDLQKEAQESERKVAEFERPARCSPPRVAGAPAAPAHEGRLAWTPARA